MNPLSKVLEDANLSKTHFAKLIGADVSCIDRYIAPNGRNKMATLRKISIGMDIVREMQAVWPDIRHYPNNEKQNKQYEKNKKQSDRLDKKFATAYKKALKKAGM